MTRPVMVLGGGVAGLAAGMYAQRRGFAPRIFEASADLGGNARTLSYRGFRFDTGAHRFHDRDAGVTADVRALLRDDLVDVSAPSQIWWRGRFVDFPLTPLNAFRALGPRTSTRALSDFVAARVRRSAGSSFEAVAVSRYGRTLAEAFLLRYSEKLWGLPTSGLSPAVAGARLQGLSLKTMLRELRPRGRGRAAHLEGRFWYPRTGIGAIADRLAHVVGRDAIRCQARITRLGHEAGRIAVVEINGAERFDAGAAEVVTTLPPALMVRLLDPPAPPVVMDAARGLRFRHVVLVTVLVDRPSITGNATIYFPGTDVAFTRGSEPRNRSAAMAPPGQTSLSLEIPCWTDDAVWSETDAAIVARCVADLSTTGLVRREHVIDACVHRLTNAYPVLEIDTTRRMSVVEQYLSSFTNLKMAGRVGQFAYVHLHDLLRSGRDLASGLHADAAPAASAT